MKFQVVCRRNPCIGSIWAKRRPLCLCGQTVLVKLCGQTLRRGSGRAGCAANAVGKGRGLDGEKWLYALPRFAELAARFAARERARRTPLAPRPPRRGSAQGRPGHGREVLRACCGVPRLGRAPSARDSTGRRRARSVRGALSLRSWPDESSELAFASTTCSTLSLEKGQCKPGGAPSTFDT